MNPYLTPIWKIALYRKLINRKKAYVLSKKNLRYRPDRVALLKYNTIKTTRNTALGTTLKSVDPLPPKKPIHLP